MEPIVALRILRSTALAQAEEVERTAERFTTAWPEAHSSALRLAQTYREAAEGANFLETLVLGEPKAEPRVIGVEASMTERFVVKLPPDMREDDRQLSDAVNEAFAEVARENPDAIEWHVLENDAVAAWRGLDPGALEIDIDLTEG